MNKYRVTYFFTNNSNIVTMVQSDLPIDEFVTDFNHKIQNKEYDFINLVGGEPYLAINKNNMAFYKIEKVKDGDGIKETIINEVLQKHKEIIGDDK